MKNERSKQSIFKSAGAISVYSALLCILIGLVVGFIILLVIDPQKAWSQGMSRILQGGFYMMPDGVGSVLANAAPLVMTGLSVGFAFKTGLFNIGAAGQYTLGAFGALLFAIVLDAPWWVCLIAATLFGAIWGAIPGIFKAYLNVNEVITAIMFNWIGLYLVNEIIYGGGKGAMFDVNSTKTYALPTYHPKAVIPDFGMKSIFNYPVTIAIFLAVIVSIVIYVVLQKTTFGYELKACGINKDAAKYAGINEKRNIVMSMIIAGALAGFGAGLFYLSGVGEWNPQTSTALPAIGFNGISVALLAASNPIGTIFSSLLISHITVGGSYLPATTYPPEIANVISGIIVYLCAFSLLFQGRIRATLMRRFERMAEQKLEQAAEKKPVEETADPEAPPEAADAPAEEGGED